MFYNKKEIEDPVEIDDTGLPNLDYFQSRTNVIATAINKSTVDYIKEHNKKPIVFIDYLKAFAIRQ